MDTTLFSVSSMVRGYHIYKDVWDAAINEELSCQREADNYTDPFADNYTNPNVLQHTCTFISETFINFHEIVMPREKA